MLFFCAGGILRVQSANFQGNWRSTSRSPAQAGLPLSNRPARPGSQGPPGPTTAAATTKPDASTKSPLRQRNRGEHSVRKELLVARQADDGGAGELLRRHRGPRRGRGVGQVPRGHGLEEPLGAPRARQRGDDVDEAQRPERGRGPAGRTSSMTCAVRRRWRASDAAAYTAGNAKGTAARMAESAGRKHARTASTTTPSTP